MKLAGLAAAEVACAVALYAFVDRGPWILTLIYAAQCALALAVMLALWTRDDRVAIALIVVTAVAMRIPTLVSAPHLSNDAYRYVWDGRLLLHGIDPHTISPLSPAAVFLRSTWLWPHIDYRSIPTIYPPLALGFFALGALDPHDLWGEKLVSLAGDVAVTIALLVGLRARGLPRGRMALYALHPLTALEFAGNAHIESWAIAGMVFAAGAPARARFFVGRVVALAAAVLTKIYPIAIAPIVFARDGSAFALTLAIVALAYLPSALHGHAFGSAANYVATQRFNGSIGAVLGTGGEIMAVAIVGIVSFFRVRRGGDVALATFATLLAFFVTSTNVLPWYILALPAMISIVENPFGNRWRAAFIGSMAWSFSVAIAYGSLTLWAEDRPLGYAMRVLEYAPLYAGLVVAALGVKRAASAGVTA